jgi:hypothetical protein
MLSFQVFQDGYAGGFKAGTAIAKLVVPALNGFK